MAVGAAFALHTILQIIIVGSATANTQLIPGLTLDGSTAVVAVVLAIVVAYVWGVILGAIIGWLYNRGLTREERRSHPAMA